MKSRGRERRQKSLPVVMHVRYTLLQETTRLAFRRNRAGRAAHHEGENFPWPTEQPTVGIRSSLTRGAERPARPRFQGQNFIRLAIDALAQTQAPIAQRSHAETMRLSEGLSRIACLYFQLFEDMIRHASALTLSYAQVGETLGQWPRVMADVVESAVKRSADASQSLADCRTPSELARWQMQTTQGAVESVIAGHQALWRFVGEVAENAAKPLRAGLPAGSEANR